ncbi:dehydrogenase/reductase (SDR family) member 7Cb isoform X2 [Triplophysa dalaica]|uniref:dehydrogenase/reductase (SDR family) member 7Cb isoform X2 n=1 Tax=Triplophysa dalaica TaxID=1582913 RepID=UPI0024DF7FAD|nr:dehydrogenase/reductase (SDR family) member 7Cb isoform X2 [Triplophysa dalaica]
MAVPSVMILPLLIVVFAGVYYVYNEVMRFMSKSMVQNKVVVITDAVSGMGSECARLFHEGGARLVLCGPSWDKLESLHDSLCNGSDPSATFTPKIVLLDFSDMENISEMITEIEESYGCVDVLICNSSMKVKAPVQNLSLDMDKTIMDVNYFGPITLAKGVLPLMITRRAGQFVLVNSIQGKLSLPFRTSYIYCKLTTHGVSSNALAQEILRTVNWHRREVLLSHPIPWMALYIRSLVPSFFFAVVAAGVKDGVMAEQLQ